METWLKILIDITVLSFLGLLYYFYQKRRILRVSFNQVINDLESFRLELNEYLEMHSSNTIGQNFCDKFENAFNQQDLSTILELQNATLGLDSKLEADFQLLCQQIHDHLTAE